MAQRLAVLLVLASIAILVCAEEATKPAATPAAAVNPSAVDVKKSEYKGHHDKKDSYEKKDKYEKKESYEKKDKYEKDSHDKKDKYEKDSYEKDSYDKKDKYEKDYDKYSKDSKYDKYDKHSEDYYKYSSKYDGYKGDYDKYKGGYKGDYDKYHSYDGYKGDYEKYKSGYKGDYNKYHSYGGKPGYGYKGDYDKYHSYDGYKGGYKGDYDKYHSYDGYKGGYDKYDKYSGYKGGYDKYSSYGGYEGYGPEGYEYDGGFPPVIFWNFPATPTNELPRSSLLKKLKDAKQNPSPASLQATAKNAKLTHRRSPMDKIIIPDYQWALKCPYGDQEDIVWFLEFLIYDLGDYNLEYTINFFGQRVNVYLGAYLIAWGVNFEDDAALNCSSLINSAWWQGIDGGIFEAVVRLRVDPVPPSGGRKLMGEGYDSDYYGQPGDYYPGYGGEYNYGEYGPGPTSCAIATVLVGDANLRIDQQSQEAVYYGDVTAVLGYEPVNLETADAATKAACAARGLPVLKPDVFKYRLQKFDL